jgi:transcription elongation factor Elf1
MKFMAVKDTAAAAEPRFQCLVCGEFTKPTSRKETEQGIVYTLVCRKCGAKDTVTVKPQTAD